MPANPGPGASGSRELPPLKIIYEDNHLLVVDKPAGIATMGTDASRPTVARQAAAYLKHKHHKPGNVYIGVVSRLDRLVSGVLLLARTSKAAGRLSEQLRKRQMHKRYVACVAGRLGQPGDSWQEVVHWVAKDERRHRMRALPIPAERAQEARLRFHTLAHEADLSLIEIDLLTGRKHQIRLQLSELGHPIVGDAKYGSDRTFSSGIALHCQLVRLVHPTRPETLEFYSSPIGHWERKNLPRRLLEAIPPSGP